MDHGAPYSPRTRNGRNAQLIAPIARDPRYFPTPLVPSASESELNISALAPARYHANEAQQWQPTDTVSLFEEILNLKDANIALTREREEARRQNHQLRQQVARLTADAGMGMESETSADSAIDPALADRSNYNFVTLWNVDLEHL
jgi:FtsZ-binding cell division protein ZapB